jgi:hypothetical protein
VPTFAKPAGRKLDWSLVTLLPTDDRLCRSAIRSTTPD